MHKSAPYRLFTAMAVLAVATFMPTNAAAQTAASQSVTVGLTAGATLSQLDSTDSTTFTNLWGAAGGLFVARTINRNFGVQIEALAVQRGAADDSSTADATFRLTYIDVPILFRFGPTAANDTHFHVFTGPVPGYRVKASLKDEKSGISVDLKDKINGFDFGWTLGAGAERGPWSIDVRYTLGLININDDEPGPDLKNRSAMAKIGYRFR